MNVEAVPERPGRPRHRWRLGGGLPHARWTRYVIEEQGYVRVGSVGKPFSGVDYYALLCWRTTGLPSSIYTRNEIISTREGLRDWHVVREPYGL